MKAADLVGGHSYVCAWWRVPRPDCTCRLAERQAAAIAIDARTEALESVVREARNDVLFNALRTGDERSGALLARIDALLAGVPHGR